MYLFIIIFLVQLCFPIIIHKHWFVFIVDLRNKLFVFLDSYFSADHNFQVQARTKLVSFVFCSVIKLIITFFNMFALFPFLFKKKIDAFKECWYQYAGGNVDVDAFSVFYPPVPKQNNV